MSRSLALWTASATAALLPCVAWPESGPQSPEFASFAEPGQADPLDYFSGDFRYSVPLFEIPGPGGSFPVTLSYKAGVSPDDEASWAGLGWTLNPGSINRQLRGLPDDFKGDTSCSNLQGGDCVSTTEDIEPNWTFGLGLDGNLELVGADTGLGLGISAGIKGYYNSYRGLGYSRTIGLSGQASANGISGGVGLNLSNDSQQGFRASPSLSLADMLSVNAAYDPIAGLSAVNVTTRYKDTILLEGDVLNFAGYAKPARMPGPGRDMTGWNIAVSVKGGGELQGVYLDLQASGFYNVEQVKNPNERFNRAVGYMNLDTAFNATPDVRDSMVLDFNREHDGAIYDDTPNLAVPVITNDLFSLSGPGVAGTFRAYRNDVPWLFDAKQTTELLGGTVGFDIGGGLIAKFGGSFSINGTKGISGGWDGGDGGALINALKTAVPSTAPADFERVYFKLIGETAPRAPGALLPGADAPVAIPIKPAPFDIANLPPDYFTSEASLTSDGSNRLPISIDGTARAPRNTLIEPFTNAQLDGNPAAFPEFTISRTQLYAQRRPGHVGGFRVTGTDGTRYIYAIPVYNTIHEEHQFSVQRANFIDGSSCGLMTPPASGTEYTYQTDHTEKFRSVRKLSPYAVTYLLTAVLGPDYIDADGTPGPSEGDYGYWVRLDYQKEAAPFAWRRPFTGAQFVRGPDNGPYVLGAQRRGDKAYFTYGEREEWFLSTIQTRTHVARFYRAARQDHHSAAGRVQNASNQIGRASSRIDRVELFARDLLHPESQWVPQQTVNFDFDYSLQRGAPGSSPATSGKLTLRKLWTNFERSTRGASSPYEFDYESGNAANNPPYAANSVDRWGTFRQLSTAVTTTQCANAGGATDPTLPATRSYSDQTLAAADRNRQVSAWSLRRIVEPSSRQVDMTYEADDYSMVQDRPATVMTRVVAVSNPNNTTPQRIDKQSHSNPVQHDALRVYIAAPAGLGTQSIKDQLVGPNGRMYFRVRVALRDGIGDPSGARWETVSGYANVIDAGTLTAADGRALAWLELEPVQGFHPFSIAAWQHLRLVQPDLVTASAISGDPSADPFSEALKFLTLSDFVEEFVGMIRGLYPTWFDRNWGQVVDLDNSFLRLRVPLGIKYGGGSRLARIEYRDRWSNATGNVEPDMVTGYKYDYRLENGHSSGVASYEPSSGTDENALRDALPFTQKVLLTSSYNLFSETPIAESYYPAPSVGYSRVVTRTVASEDARARALAGNVPTRTSTLGPVVREFYTASDFPTRTSQTTLTKKRNPQPWMVPIPFLGQITLNSLAAAQGYAVSLNDMHGKPRRVARYEYGPGWDPVAQDFQMRGLPDESTEYIYRATGGAGNSRFTLDEHLPVFTADAQRAGTDPVFAHEAELLVDTRRNRTESFDAGLNVNVDLTYALFPIPLIVPVPSLAYSLSEAKTAVTMKVVHQSGMLDHILETKGPSQRLRQLLAFDSLTGQPLLTSVTNDFGDAMYSYVMPARWQYPRMGAAYPVSGIKLPLAGAQLVGTDTLTVANPSIPACAETGARGALCLPLGSRFAAGSSANAVGLVLESANAGQLTLRANRNLGAVPGADAMLVESGDANLLESEVGTINALSDPTTGRTPADCRWSTTEACGVCYVKEKTTSPSCAASMWVALLGNENGKGKGDLPDCKIKGQTIGRDTHGRAIGAAVKTSRNRNQAPVRNCRLVLTDDHGNVVDESDVSATQSPHTGDAAPAPQADGLPYTGVSFQAVVGGDKRLLYVYSDCDGWIDEETHSKPLVNYCDTEHRQTRQKIKDVLAASALLYSDTWPSVTEQIRFAGTGQQIAAANSALATRSGFDNGSRGIWRSSREYQYVEDRRQSSAVNLRRDGTFDLTLFDWSDPDNPVCAPQWRWQSQVTRYAPSGNETEEVSPIGVYSSSLYGHVHRVPIAVANNSRSAEIASESFEAFKAGEQLITVQTGEGNYRFQTLTGTERVPTLNCPRDVIVRAQLDGQLLRLADSNITVETGQGSTLEQLKRADVDLGKMKAEIPGVRCPLPVRGGDVDAQGRMTLVVDPSEVACTVPLPERAELGRLHEQYDDIRLRFPCEIVEVEQTVKLVDLSSAKAHTGTKSLAIGRHHDFLQPDLALVPGRRYVVSAWISRDNTDVATYANSATTGVQIKFWNGTQELAASRAALIRPDGPVIDGWQRVQGTFVYPAGANLISIGLQNGADSGGGRAYFDDVRLMPEDSRIETFVYDPANLRVVARLDAENYAKVFTYHPDGSLAQTQQETEAGKLTVLESRMHPAERP